MSRRKGVLFSLSLLAFAICTSIFFREPIFCFGVESVLNRYFPVSGGWKFHTESIKIRGRKLLLPKASFSCEGIEGVVEELAIGLKEISFVTHTLSLRLEKNGPPVFDVQAFLKGPRIIVEKGTLILVDQDKKNTFSFSLALQDTQDLSGALDLFFEKEKNANFSLHWLGVGDGWKTQVEMQEAPMTELFAISRFFELESGPWEVEEGNIDGKVEATIKNGALLSHIKSAVTLSSLEAKQKKTGIKVGSEKLSLDLTYPYGKENTKEESSWWEKAGIQAELSRGRIALVDSFAIDDLTGQIHLSCLKNAEVVLKGELDYQGERSSLLLTGKPNSIDKKGLDFDLKLRLEPESTHFTHLNLTLAEEAESGWSLRGKFSEVGVEEIAIVQHILSFTFPKVKDFQITQGELTCAVSAHLQKGEVEKVLIDSLEAENLELYWNSQDLSLFVTHAKGNAELERGSNALLSLPFWNLSVKEGNLVYGQKSESPFSLTHIDTDLSLSKNTFSPSRIRAECQGVEIEAKIKGDYSSATLQVHLATEGSRFLSLFDKEGRLEENPHLSTDLFIEPVDGVWNAQGVLIVREKEKEEYIEYGFRINEEIKKIERASLLASLKKAVSQVYYVSSESSFLFLELLQKGFDLKWALAGKGAFYGSFDNNLWSLSLKGSHLLFTSPSYNIESRKEFSGNIAYYSQKGELEGFFPLRDATIIDKSTNLVFHDTQADMMLFKDGARCRRVKTEVEGLVVEGDLEIDTSATEGSQWKIDVTNVVGSAKQLQNILTHFKGLENFAFPFDGRIQAAQEGLSLQIDFRNEAPSVDFGAHLHFLHGTYTLFPDLKVHDLSFNLDWDSLGKTLTLTDITGRLCAHEGKKEMPFYGKHITLQGDPRGDKEVFFDLRLEEEWMSLVRLLGSYKSTTGEVEIYPEYSHFFGEKISHLRGVIHEGQGIESLDCKMQLSLVGLPKMMRLLTDFGGRERISYVDYIPYNTEMLDVAFSLNEGEWKFLFAGENLGLEGYGNPSFWKVEHLNVGPYNASCQLRKDETNYAVEEFKVSSPYGEANLSRGVVDFIEKKVFFPLETSSLSLPEVAFFDLQGEAVIDFSESLLTLETKVQVEGSYGKEDALKFRSMTPIKAHFSFDQGLEIEASTLVFSQEPFFSLECEVPNLIYEKEGGFLSGNKIKASLTRKSMLHLKEAPFFSSLSWVENLPIRAEGDTVFLLDFTRDEGKFKISGALEKGLYGWQGKTFKVEDCTFAYDEKHLDFYVDTYFLGQEFGISINALPYNDFAMTIKAFPIVKGELQKGKEAVFLESKGITREDFSIQKWEGSIFGCDYNFLPLPAAQENAPLTFLATMRLDMEKLSSVLSVEMQNFVKDVQLKKGFELKGELAIPKQDLSEISFEGFLQGKDFDFLGALLKTFFAEIRFGKGRCSVDKLEISDSAVNVSIPSLVTKNIEGKGWTLEVPEVKVVDLRPSILKKRGDNTPHKIRPFRVKSFVLQDIKGELASPRTFSGKGHLSFVNTFKEGLILLDLPLEILSRLGLDMALLVPIQGEMDINIKDSKLVFSRLKNSFSEGKRSNFYFHNRSESYVDFHGNIHMDIRMKQFVLFKITQPFTLSIRGTLSQPKVALR